MFLFKRVEQLSSLDFALFNPFCFIKQSKLHYLPRHNPVNA
jgi:hypothetical protein